MTEMITREDKITDAYIVLGCQYYALARYCAEFQYQPVGSTLFHHAIEMLLKGYLSRFLPKSKLKKIGHDLEKLWTEFATNNKDSQMLSRFNSAVSELNKIEDLRYPESMVDDGLYLNIRIGAMPLTLPGGDKLPKYSIEVLDLDEITSEIIKRCNTDAKIYFKNLPKDLEKTLPSSFLT